MQINKNTQQLLKSKLPLADENFDYNDPNNKSKGYKVTERKSDLFGKIELNSGDVFFD
tara:strand:+ start:531 stop:704 length:174 start_codon:yes stop_codon:yes gene_type:complete